MTARLLRLALPALLATACATTSNQVKSPEDATAAAAPEITLVRPYDRPEIVAIRERTKTLLEAQSRLVWQAWTSSEPIDLAATYEGTADLFSPQSIALVRQASLDAKGDEARALERLELYLGGEAIAQRTQEAALALAKAQAAATITLDGKVRPWRHLEALLAAEPSAAVRASLFASEAPVVAQLTTLIVERDRQLDEAARALGWPSALDYALRLRDADAASLAALAESTLTATQTLYEEAMGELVHRELALPLARVRRADLPRLMRASSTEIWFPAAALPDTVLGLPAGVDLADQRNVKVETNPRARQQPLCVPVTPPSDVRLVLAARAGLSELRLALREASCAAAAANVKASHWELQRFTPPALGEVWATLFELPTRAPVWLSSKGVPDDQRQRLVGDGTARRLQALRLDAARVLFALQRSEADDPAALWRSLASRATGFDLTESDAARWALVQNAQLEAADRLQGALLAAQVNRKLMERHSAMWWNVSAAGHTLAGLWAQGAATTPSSLAQQLELDALSPDALVSTLSEQRAAR